MAEKSPRRVDLRPEYERLGRWLRSEREKTGKSQRTVSQELRKTANFISKVESGLVRLDVVEFLDLADVLKIPESTALAELKSFIGFDLRSRSITKAKEQTRTESAQ